MDEPILIHSVREIHLIEFDRDKIYFVKSILQTISYEDQNVTIFFWFNVIMKTRSNQIRIARKTLPANEGETAKYYNRPNQ